MYEIILTCKNYISEIRAENSWYVELAYILGVIFYLFVIMMIIMVFVEVGKVILTLECGFFGYMIYDCVNMERVNGDIVVFGIILLIAIFVILMILNIHEDYYGCGLIETFFDSLLGGLLDIVIILSIGVFFVFPFGIFICSKRDRY